MKDFLTLNKNMLGATTSGTSFSSSRRGSSSSGSSGSSSSSTSSSSTKIDKTTTPPGAVGFHSSSGESWTVYYDSNGNKYNSIEEYQAEMKRQEEERKRQEEEQQRGHGSAVNRRETFSAHGVNVDDNGNPIPGGNYSFSLDDETVRDKINSNSEDDNTLLYAILAAVGVVGVAFWAKKNKNKNKKKKK